MNIIVVGCGRVGSALAYQCYRKGHQVTVVDMEGKAFDNLPVDFRGRTIEGDVLVRNVLHRAEIESCQALAAATASDSLNALVASIARRQYGVGKVVARNYDPRQRSLQEAFGIPVIGSATAGTRQMEEFLTDAPLRALSVDGAGGQQLFQLAVPARWAGTALAALIPDEQTQVLAWTRAGQLLPVSKDQLVQADDLLIIHASSDAIEALDKRMSSQEERQL